MPDIIVPDVVQLDVLMQFSTVTQAMNSYYLQQDGGWSNEDVIATLEAVEAAWTTNIAPVTQGATSLIGARARDLNTNPYGAPVEIILDDPVAGTLAGDAFPSWACGVVQMIGDTGGTPSRSYIRHLGLGESQASGNALLNAARTAISTAYTDFLADVTGTIIGMTNVIVSKVLNGAPRSPAVYNTLDHIQTRSQLGRAISRYGVRP